MPQSPSSPWKRFALAGIQQSRKLRLYARLTVEYKSDQAELPAADIAACLCQLQFANSSGKETKSWCALAVLLCSLKSLECVESGWAFSNASSGVLLYCLLRESPGSRL